MRPILVIARLMLREVLRRRLILALLALTVVAIALTAWGFSRIPALSQRGVPIPEAQARLIASQLLIDVMFMFSHVLALAAGFVASPALSVGLGSGVARALASRPTERAPAVLGVALG